MIFPPHMANDVTGAYKLLLSIGAILKLLYDHTYRSVKPKKG